MPIVWKVNPKELLKEHGYTSYRIRQEKIIGQQTYRNLSQCSTEVTLNTLSTICEITGKQPGKLIEFVPEKKSAKKEGAGAAE